MEGPQEKRPVKTFNNLTIRIRNLHGAARQEELRKLNILFQTELLAKQKRGEFFFFFMFFRVCESFFFFPLNSQLCLLCFFTFVCVSVLLLFFLPYKNTKKSMFRFFFLLFTSLHFNSSLKKIQRI